MRPRLGLLVSFALFPLLATASTAAAQAWVSDKGELSLSLRGDYQTASGVYHGEDGLITGLSTRAVNSSLSIEYVPIAKLATALTLNANGAAYTGPQSLPQNPSFALNHGTQDDGSMYWNVTDLDFNARYQAYDGPVTLTPNLHLRTPVTDYENNGYAAAGTHLKEASLGLSIGKYGLGAEDLVLQAGYMFTFVSKEDRGGAATEQFRTNRSDFDLSLAYIFNDKFVAAVGAALRITHDGFELEDYPELMPGDPLIKWHDPVLKQMYLAPTVLASYQVTPTFSLAGNFAIIVVGNNVSNAMTFGLTAGFSTNLGGGASVEPDASVDMSTEASATTE
jgi:hypothetical protein